MAANKTDIYVAKESGSADVKGETYVFHKGITRVRAGHPLLKANPQYFEPIEFHVTYEYGKGHDVEQATAAPGEQRG